MNTRKHIGALGLIAGTGFYSLEMLENAKDIVLDSNYGSVRTVAGSLHGRETYFVSRHRADHSVPPHLVNFRANIDGLAGAGVTEILAGNDVSGIGHAADELVVVDDFLDFTKQRALRSFDGSTTEGVVHIDVGEPYSLRLRQAWLDAAHELRVDDVPHGIYAATEGPRCEHASLCLVANPAAGQSDYEITIDELMAVVAERKYTIGRVMDAAARILSKVRNVTQ